MRELQAERDRLAAVVRQQEAELARLHLLVAATIRCRETAAGVVAPSERAGMGSETVAKKAAARPENEAE